MKKIEGLEKKLKIKFRHKNLLKEALVHRSYLNETNKKILRANERLEFLGDAILSFIISEWLFKEFPNYLEGSLTNLRSNLVKTGSLAKIAKKFNLGECLLLSRGEKESGGQKNPLLLANTLEAIIGAIFLDQGLEAVKKFIYSHFEKLLLELEKAGEFKDFKSLLQENLQAKIKQSPVYKTIKEEGPAHAKIFTIGVFSQDKLVALGRGKSKQSAEEEAAKIALEKLNLKS